MSLPISVTGWEPPNGDVALAGLQGRSSETSRWNPWSTTVPGVGDLPEAFSWFCMRILTVQRSCHSLQGSRVYPKYMANVHFLFLSKKLLELINSSRRNCLPTFSSKISRLISSGNSSQRTRYYRVQSVWFSHSVMSNSL